MGKLFVRLTIVLTSIFFFSSFFVAQYYGIDILYDFHISAFEFCVVIYCYSEGKYHCRYLKYCALAVFLADTISRVDNTFDFLTVSQHNLFPLSIIALGVGTSLLKAVLHFIKVIKVKHERNKSD